MVSDAVAPAVRVFGLFDFSVVMVVVEINVCVIYFDVWAVLEIGKLLLGAEVRFDERLEIERLPVEFAEVVVIGVVASSEVIADPVFVMEIDICCNLVS